MQVTHEMQTMRVIHEVRSLSGVPIIMIIGLDPLVQAVRVEIERVCALLEEMTIFCPDDQ